MNKLGTMTLESEKLWVGLDYDAKKALSKILALEIKAACKEVGAKVRCVTGFYAGPEDISVLADMQTCSLSYQALYLIIDKCLAKHDLVRYKYTQLPDDQRQTITYGVNVTITITNQDGKNAWYNSKEDL